MNERSAGILLQLIVLTISTASAQIQFPEDYPTPQRARSTQSYVPNLKAQTQQTSQSSTAYIGNSYEQHVASIISQGFSKLVLDVNRITQAISPDVAQADYVVYGPVTIAGKVFKKSMIYVTNYLKLFLGALALVLLASIGQTFDEVANCLGLSSGLNIKNNPIYVQQQIGKVIEQIGAETGIGIGHHVNYAAAIFIQQDFPIRPAYLEIASVYYKSNVMNLDFLGNPQNAKHVINTWVSGRTNKKIPSLLDEAPSTETNAIIASVLYFQAAWQFPFFNGHTKLHPFYTNGRKKPSTRMVEMMSNGGEFPYYKDQRLGVEIMGFPYKGNQTTMYVIIPFESNKEKLRQVENSLTPADLDHLVGSTRYTETVILFPKMRLESTVDLRSTLEMMGVKSLFDPAKANLALLSPGVNQRFNEANEAPFVSPPISATPVRRLSVANHNQIQRPTASQAPQENLEQRLVFNRFNEQASCTPVYDPATDTTKCQVSLYTDLHQIQRRKRASPRAARAGTVKHNPVEELEQIRQQVNQSPVYANPGLYADQVIHKVYIDITESGTEAAAATGISLNRSGGRVTFRVDIPFLFFIYHEESRLVLFWGSVKTPPSAAT